MAIVRQPSDARPQAPSRLDQALVARGFAATRSQAQALINAGHVHVRGLRRVRPASPVSPETELTVDDASRYVGRAARKLEGALADFPEVRVRGRVALDAGASTGGFTQVLLDSGAKHIFAVDVGHGQLVAELSNDPAISDVQGVNLRDFALGDLQDSAAASAGIGPADIDLVVADVSFISLTLVLPRIQQQIGASDLVLLVKPQFEGDRRSGLNSAGIVTDPVRRAAAVRRVIECGMSLGLVVRGVAPSRLVGAHGNREYVVWLASSGQNMDWESAVRGIERGEDDA